MSAPNPVVDIDYDTVELRTGRLQKIRRSEGRVMGGLNDRMFPVVKCYCRSHDVLTPLEAEMQKRPSFVFSIDLFENLESLIGRDLVGRIYTDTRGRRVRFYLDLKEHAGFQLSEEGDHHLNSPWYDESVLKE